MNKAGRLPFTHVQVVSRFWKDVTKGDDCWLWVGRKDKDGYGELGLRRFRSAHRFSYLIHKGAIPKGKWVLHTCDNPSCVNPNHLFIGTAKTNVVDSIQKGRRHHQKTPKGSYRPHHKLTNEDVISIRTQVSTGQSQRIIASQFGVSQSNISMIVNKKRWRVL